MAEYTEPVVEDLGRLEDLTKANAFTGAEDGGSKLLVHHDAPVSVPAGP